MAMAMARKGTSAVHAEAYDRFLFNMAVTIAREMASCFLDTPPGTAARGQRAASGRRWVAAVLGGSVASREEPNHPLGARQAGTPWLVDAAGKAQQQIDAASIRAIARHVPSAAAHGAELRLPLGTVGKKRSPSESRALPPLMESVRARHMPPRGGRPSPEAASAASSAAALPQGGGGAGPRTTTITTTTTATGSSSTSSPAQAARPAGRAETGAAGSRAARSPGMALSGPGVRAAAATAPPKRGNGPGGGKPVVRPRLRLETPRTAPALFVTKRPSTEK